jgi:hypothetical protein
MTRFFSHLTLAADEDGTLVPFDGYVEAEEP